MKRYYFLTVVFLISFLALTSSCSLNQKQTRAIDTNTITDAAVGALPEKETPETTATVAKEKEKPERIMEDLSLQEAEKRLRDIQEDVTETKNSRLR